MTALLKILYVIGMIALWVATSKMAYLEYKEEWG